MLAPDRAGAPGKNPKAAIEIQRGQQGQGNHGPLLEPGRHDVGPQEITGKVTRQVIAPASEPAKTNVAFHTPGWVWKTTIIRLSDLLKQHGFDNISGERAPSAWHYYMLAVRWSCRSSRW